MARNKSDGRTERSPDHDNNADPRGTGRKTDPPHAPDVGPPSAASDARGLPDETARIELATTYLSFQARLWPDLVRAWVVPKPTRAKAIELAAAFCDRFTDERTDVTPVGGPAGVRLGAVYLRYLCDHSNPRSLDQQLKNVLERAAQDRVFVPWAYVFADAAVSGTTAARRGYRMAKAVLKSGPGGLSPVCTSTNSDGPAGTPSSRSNSGSWPPTPVGGSLGRAMGSTPRTRSRR
ncbi:hypothetical protein [Fimbriiglobus ruber]|uniref:Uncharacterized protein n=1 Tax=Fimbriiglobus ruber TaxID=1908690 RepID=A0A225DAA0_9BACT|nr:hypothetical protein [Fimbriiglobus ruber]OWK35690.1 hypothetical protein FRUB_08253 [Fimbriiglobus ruber]OWK38382.1 hypothetical protein FRUB_07502 [Fimbriiglobus ruber]